MIRIHGATSVVLNSALCSHSGYAGLAACDRGPRREPHLVVQLPVVSRPESWDRHREISELSPRLQW